MNDDLEEWVRTNAPDLLDDWHRLRRLGTVLDDYYRQRWQRRLPAADALVDRWDRAARLGFGDGASVYDSALVIGDVSVGAGTWVGPATVLDGSGGLTIGAHCSISTGVQVYSHVSVEWALSGGRAGPTHAETRIGSNTYLGPNAVVAMGVTIGDRCIVGANSLVLQDLPDGTYAHGTPARVVGTTDDYLARKRSEAAQAPEAPAGDA